MKQQLTMAALAWVVTSAAAEAGQATPGREPPFRGDLQQLAEQNTDFRRVLFTGPHIQVVALTLRPGEDIGEEVHDVDQCFFFVQGQAQTVLDGSPATIGENGLVCISARTRHNIRNAGREALKLLTTYAPPQHPAGTVHRTKAEALAAEGAPPEKR
jgi:mannose-6-phosphate isomerase-like protein (cupin superfamily)